MTQELSAAAKTRIYEVLTKGPFGAHVGFTIDEITNDRAVVRMLGAPHIMNGLGIVHGGATATLIDTTATAAAWATPEAQPTTRGTTVAMTINYLSGGQSGDMIGEGLVVSRGGTLTVVDVFVRDERGTTVAKGQVTYKLDLARDRRLAKG